MVATEVDADKHLYTQGESEKKSHHSYLVNVDEMKEQKRLGEGEGRNELQSNVYITADYSKSHLFPEGCSFRGV